MAVGLLMAAQATAQTAFATLIHEGTLSSFTGVDALKDAAAAAADGDVITLSSGTFNGCDITKAITLRGAGMEADELGRQTIIQSNIILDAKNKEVSVEGLFMKSIEGWVASLFLNKCTITERCFQIHSQSTAVAEQTVIMQCKIKNLYDSHGIITIYNSYINHSEASERDIFYNCTIESISGNYTRMLGKYYNCIYMGTTLLYPGSTASQGAARRGKGFRCSHYLWWNQ